MIEVKVNEGDGQFERAIRLFKKLCLKDGFMMELRERRYFIKPSVKKRAERNSKKRRRKT
ncbi:30S ribosomal protein S21 [Candidatus Woesearchaeota archaeon]|nr:MAG: 30S ribosomal protein S21 [Candidatus Woesearchaeota archaeon]